VAKLVKSRRRVGHAYIGAKAPRQSHDNRMAKLAFSGLLPHKNRSSRRPSSDRETR